MIHSLNGRLRALGARPKGRLCVVGLLAVGIFSIVFSCEKRGGGTVSSDNKDIKSADENNAPKDDILKEEDNDLDSILAQSEKFYATREVFERPVSGYQKDVPGVPSLSAEACGACHTEIYKEWKLSAHAHASTGDPQYMAELAKSRSEPPYPQTGDLGWLCVNCHTPLINQQERVVVGLKDNDMAKPIYRKNPGFQPELVSEGINCASCHVRNGEILGPYGSKLAPHPVRKEPEMLETSFCERCHEAEKTYQEKNFGCFFKTGRERRNAAIDNTCQDCHMPMVERKVAPDFENTPVRKTRRHWFGGSMIPKGLENAGDVVELAKHFPKSLHVKMRGDGDRLVLSATNVGAGHNVPTGDPERFIEFEMIVYDPIYTTIPLISERYEIGSRYQWWPEIKEVFSNRLVPGGTIDFSLNLAAVRRKVCRWAPGGANISVSNVRGEGKNVSLVEVVERNIRMRPEAFDHHNLDGKSTRGRVVYRGDYWVDWNCDGTDGAAPKRL